MAQTARQPPASQPAAAKGQPILRARGVKKDFRMGESTVPVLKGVDLTLHPGEFVAIEGRSGSGKSTLMHILGALDAPDDGRIEFEGREYSAPGPEAPSGASPWTSRALFGPMGIVFVGLAAVALEVVFWFAPAVGTWFGYVPWLARGVLLLLATGFAMTWWYWREREACRLRNTQFGFVFQFYHLLPELDVLENTLLAPRIEHSWLGSGARRRALRQRATELLDQLGMGHRLTHRPNQLSGGERQRVAIARALMNEPRILFADEPTGNLDAETGRQIMAVLETLHRDRGQTVVMVTHDRALARTADRVLVLKDGRLEKAEG